MQSFLNYTPASAKQIPRDSVGANELQGVNFLAWVECVPTTNPGPGTLINEGDFVYADCAVPGTIPQDAVVLTNGGSQLNFDLQYAVTGFDKVVTVWRNDGPASEFSPFRLNLIVFNVSP